MILFQDFLKTLYEILVWFLGNRDDLMCTLIIFSIADLFTGLLSSVITHQFDGNTFREGLCKKLYIFILVGIGHTIDINLFHREELLRTLILFFFISREGISVCKNISKLGIPIPEGLKKELLWIVRDEKDEPKEE